MALTLSPGVLDISGEDARSFLQAIVSSDVDELKVGNAQPSLLLTPAGKVVSTMLIYRADETQFLLVSEKSSASVIAESLGRLLIRTKAEITDVSGEYSVRIVEETPEGTRVLEEHHLGIDNARLILESVSDHDDRELYEELRISHGAVSLKEVADTIPQEAHLDKNAVSFSKGCYLGQELVCRIDSREASTPFSFYATSNAAAGEVISQRSTTETELGGFICGPYSAIVRIPRKEIDALDVSVTHEVSGNFTI